MSTGATLESAQPTTQTSPPAVSDENRPVTLVRLSALALVTGGLLWGGFFPLNLGSLGWVALVPFALMCVANASGSRLFLASFLAGVCFFVPALQWIRVAHPMMYFAWIGLALACALFVPMVLALVRRLTLRGKVPLTLALPAAWVGLEWVRGSLLGGFPWYFLGHTQHDFLPMIQMADTTGAYGISFVLASVAGLLASMLLRVPGVARWLGHAECPTGRFPIVSTACVVVLVGVCVGYGYWQLDHEPFRDGPRVALVQGNVPQEVRNAKSGNSEQDARRAIVNMRDHHLALSFQAAGAEPRPDLIIWPETSYPLPWLVRPESRPDAMPDDGWNAMIDGTTAARVGFATLAERHGTSVVLGLNTWQLNPDGKDVKFNTALMVSPGGDEPATYHKMHRVPFGEFVPFKETLPFMGMFTPYDGVDYGIEAGTEFTRFRVTSADGETFTFGALICYEDSDPTLARSYVGGQTGEDVDFLVNISNDGWFKRTEEHEQHLAICRFRAVEARRAVVRSVNMGISAIIDADGRVVAIPGETWSDSKEPPESTGRVVHGVVPIDDRPSRYAMLGDWLPASCGLILLTGLALSFRRSAGM